MKNMEDGFSNSSSSSSSTSFSPHISPKSPPPGFDLFGKRRQLVKVQILEREIGLLQEELKSVEDFQPASRCCKELNDYVGAKQDPLVSINQDTHKSHLCWKRLCTLPRISCFNGCQPHLKLPKCCACCHAKLDCSEKTARRHCCECRLLPCPQLGYCCFSSSVCNCTKVNLCCSCSNNCC